MFFPPSTNKWLVFYCYIRVYYSVTSIILLQGSYSGETRVCCVTRVVWHASTIRFFCCKTLLFCHTRQLFYHNRVCYSVTTVTCLQQLFYYNTVILLQVLLICNSVILLLLNVWFCYNCYSVTAECCSLLHLSGTVLSHVIVLFCYNTTFCSLTKLWFLLE